MVIERRSTGGIATACVAGLVWLVWLCSASRSFAGDRAGRLPDPPSDPAAVEFFEKSVRPLLVSRCQGCHGSVKQKGGLRLDARESIIAGGNSGPTVVPGDAKASLLVDAINYGETYQMPPKSKLPEQEIATLTRWVEMGAPWGRDVAPSLDSKGATSDFQARLRERARFWSFQPLRRIAPPTPDAPGWARNPIDRFILAGLARLGLEPSPEAGRRTLIRRLSFDLIGLPPTAGEVEAFLADRSPDAYERAVDRLLASPRYGERWARHWLDLVRYAETAGHEFDYEIPNAYRYRDYVIRALNADVPYDGFLVEHLAGDLLECPRRHPVEQFNESIIATGFYFLGEGTHSPVDVREEEVRRIDNQIDVISKAFLGLTVSCARCHDHKFDPIASRDYYAMAGFLRSSRCQHAFIDPPDRISDSIRRLNQARDSLVATLAEAKAHLPRAIPRTWGRVRGPASDEVFEDFDRDDYGDWHVTGDAFGERPTKTGDIRLDLGHGSARLERIGAGQAHSGVVSDRLRGVLRSRTFTIRTRYIHYLVAGRGGTLNVVVDGFEKIRDPIYGGLTKAVNIGDRLRWITQDVGMWMGQTAYFELADGAVPDYHGAKTGMNEGHGYLAVDEIRMSDQPAPPLPPWAARSEPLELPALVAAIRPSQAELARRLEDAIDRCRAIDAAIPEPRLALAIADGTGLDEHVHIRGNHKNLGEVVPRRFLEVLGGATPGTPGAGSGRRDLARRLVDPRANPLTPRVLVNRLWKHHFGEGIVKSTDDFGAMGRNPSHPELLDWLASEFVDRGWSIKAIQRLIVTSAAYRMASVPAGEAERLDPDNALLHRMNVRRLEAEAIRDAVLNVSGRLASEMYGPSVPVHLTSFMDGRGRPSQSGPLDGDGRRSIYLGVRRNFLNPMFLAFDAPVPSSCMGRRNTSNVPAQALILLNDPLVIQQAQRWAARIQAAPARDDRDRLDRLFADAFGRPPSRDESRDCMEFLRRSGWADLCHVVINMKEFVFID